MKNLKLGQRQESLSLWVVDYMVGSYIKPTQGCELQDTYEFNVDHPRPVPELVNNSYGQRLTAAVPRDDNACP
jgi:hypothetical protein